MQWRREQNNPDCDLSDCRALIACFTQEVFGGALIGNSQHQFVRLYDGDLLDIAQDCRAVLNGEVCYDVDTDLTLEQDTAMQAQCQRWVAAFALSEKSRKRTLSDQSCTPHSRSASATCAP